MRGEVNGKTWKNARSPMSVFLSSFVDYFRVVAVGLEPGSEVASCPWQEISRPVSEILRQTRIDSIENIK